MDNSVLQAVKLTASAFEFLLLLVIVPVAAHRRAERGDPDFMLHTLLTICLIKSAFDIVSGILPLPLLAAACLAGALEMAVVTLWYLFFMAYLWNSPRAVSRGLRLSMLWTGVWLVLLAAAALRGHLPGQHGNADGGGLYYAMSWLPVLPLLLTEALLLFKRKNLHPRDIAILALFPLPALSGLALAYLMPGLPWKCPGLALGLLAVNLYLQSRTAQKDPLTGAYTRAWFKAKLAERLKDARTAPFMLLMLDLDHFKKINDTWGHLEGDRALVTVVELLRKSLRTSDIIARFAGDEFLVLAGISHSGECDIIMKRIKDHLHEYNLSSGKPYTLGWSTGMLYCDKAQSPDELLALVDGHMYRAKKQSKR